MEKKYNWQQSQTRDIQTTDKSVRTVHDDTVCGGCLDCKGPTFALETTYSTPSLQTLKMASHKFSHVKEKV